MTDETTTPEQVRAFYDAVAREYAENLADELEGKPLDRALLERFAAEVRGGGPVYDLGCGPGGQTTAFLHALGVDVRGMDVSPAAVAEAARRHPDIRFETGDMLALPMADGSAAGIVGFYSIVHFSPEQLRRAIGEMARVLRPGAPLLLSFHVGDETVHVDELFGVRASLDFAFIPWSAWTMPCATPVSRRSSRSCAIRIPVWSLPPAARTSLRAGRAAPRRPWIASPACVPPSGVKHLTGAHRHPIP